MVWESANSTVVLPREFLQEPTSMGTFEGAAITVLARDLENANTTNCKRFPWKPICMGKCWIMRPKAPAWAWKESRR